MYTPRTSVEAIPDASIHHSALQKQQQQLAIGHMYDRRLKVPVIHMTGCRRQTRAASLV